MTKDRDPLFELKVILDREERFAAHCSELRAAYSRPASGRAVIEHVGKVQTDEERLVAAIKAATKRGDKELHLLIDGTGGNTTAMFRIVDALEGFRGTKRGIVVGKCASASCVILTACDERIAPPDAEFLVHACGMPKHDRSPKRWTSKQLDALAAKSAMIDARISAVYLRQTKSRKLAEMNQDGEDHHLSAQTARSLNLVTRIEPVDATPRSDMTMESFYRPGRARALAALAAVAPRSTPSFLSVEIKGSIGPNKPVSAAKVQQKLAAAPFARSLWVSIDSVGGDYHEAMRIYAALREHPAPRKQARVFGNCMSAAMLPLLACDLRGAWPSANMMIHKCEISLRDHRDKRWTDTRLAEAAAQAERTDAALVDLMVQRTGFDRQWFVDEMSHERNMTIQDALKSGIIHEIVGVTRAPEPNWPAQARTVGSKGPTGLPSYLISENYLRACRSAG